MENIPKNMLIAFSEADNTLSLVRNNSTLAEGTITNILKLQGFKMS